MAGKGTLENAAEKERWEKEPVAVLNREVRRGTGAMFEETLEERSL